MLRSIREAIPSDWRTKCEELRALGDVSLTEYLEETGLELEDVYATTTAGPRCAAPGFAAGEPSTTESSLLRAVGRLLHVDDFERIAAYRALVEHPRPTDLDGVTEPERRLARMLVGSLTSLRTADSFARHSTNCGEHATVRGGAPRVARSAAPTCGTRARTGRAR